MSNSSLDSTKSQNFLGLAHQDYLASRFLLCNGFLAQGASLAATAVEKYLKAVLVLKGFFTKKHLESALIKALQDHHPSLYQAIDQDFIKFLKRSFKLRYATVEGEGFGIVINQHRTLLALDQTIVLIDSGFSRSGSGTPLQQGLAAKDSTLMDRNVPLGAMSLQDLAQLRNQVQEVLVGKKFQTISANYETEGLNITGSMMKKPQFSFKTGKGRLSLG